MVKNFKLQLQERISNKKLPKLARLKEDNNIECILCKFLCKEEISFTKHYATPNHKKVFFFLLLRFRRPIQTLI